MPKVKPQPEPDGRLFRFELTIEYDAERRTYKKDADDNYVRDSTGAVVLDQVIPFRQTHVARNGKGYSEPPQVWSADKLGAMKTRITVIKRQYEHADNATFNLKVYCIDPDAWQTRDDLSDYGMMRTVTIDEVPDIEDVLLRER